MSAEGTFVAINNKISQSVPHLHVHVVPRRRKDGLKGFFWPRYRYADEGRMREVAERIRAAVELLQARDRVTVGHPSRSITLSTWNPGRANSFDRFKPAFQKSGQYDPPGIPPLPRRKDFLENGPFQVHDQKVRAHT